MNTDPRANAGAVLQVELHFKISRLATVFLSGTPRCGAASRTLGESMSTILTRFIRFIPSARTTLLRPGIPVSKRLDVATRRVLPQVSNGQERHEGRVEHIRRIRGLD